MSRVAYVHVVHTHACTHAMDRVQVTVESRGCTCRFQQGHFELHDAYIPWPDGNGGMQAESTASLRRPWAVQAFAACFLFRSILQHKVTSLIVLCTSSPQPPYGFLPLIVLSKALRPEDTLSRGPSTPASCSSSVSLSLSN